MIAIYGCSKGGVGKSTACVNVAAHRAIEGSRVCIVDADKQGHSAGWCAERMRLAVDLPRVHAQVMSKSLAEPLRKLAADYDDIVVDAGGADSQELRSAMRVADVIVMPFSASQFDLWAVETMAEMVSIAREYNPKLAAVAFINKAETNWVRSKAATAALEFIQSFDAIYCAQTMVHLRPAPFMQSLEGGRSVFEMGRGGDKAADEIAALVAEVNIVMDEYRRQCGSNEKSGETP